MTKTVSDLIQECIDISEDNSSEFAAFLPNAIYRAEDRLYRLLDLDFSSETTLATISANEVVVKPATHRVTHNLYIMALGKRQRLTKKTKSFLRDYWPDTTLLDVPKYYAEDNVNFYLAPTPNGVYPVIVEFEGQPEPLTGTNTTNIYTEKYYDLLFYATMSNMAEWAKDIDRQGQWESRIQEAMETVNNEGRRQRQDDNTNVHNPNGGRNTKVKDGV